EKHFHLKQQPIRPCRSKLSHLPYNLQPPAIATIPYILKEILRRIPKPPFLLPLANYEPSNNTPIPARVLKPLLLKPVLTPKPRGKTLRTSNNKEGPGEPESAVK